MGGLPDASGSIDRTLLEAGIRARQQGEVVEALELWRKHRGHFPFDPAGYCHSANFLRELNRPEAAERVLQDGLERCPDDPLLGSEYGWLALAQKDWTEALHQWRRVLAKTPADPIACTGAAQALLQLEQYAAAEAQLKPATEGLPNDYNVAVLCALIATQSRRWEDAHQRWTRVQKIRPDCEMAAGQLAALGAILHADSAAKPPR